MTPETIFTIGHSTRTIEAFLALLRQNAITQLADVRKMPASRRHPQFGKEALARNLAEAGIGYRHMPGLGGLRKGAADSVNTGWRNASFRAYADYMQTPEFAQHLKALIEWAAHAQTVIMCAEAVPWRCHRSLIADALITHHIPVFDIIEGPARAHALNPMAKLEGEHVTYPAQDLFSL
jgi:uncharacterized protein (DUF488 family)